MDIAHANHAWKSDIPINARKDFNIKIILSHIFLVSPRIIASNVLPMLYWLNYLMRLRFFKWLQLMITNNMKSNNVN